MKQCKYCAERIRDGAIKCRYCGSVLATLTEPAQREANDVPAKSGSVTYILDKDLIRFSKFATSILAIFAIVGAFLYGFDLKQAAKEVKDSQEEAKRMSREIQDSKRAVEKITREAASILNEARVHLSSISKSSEEARGIVANLPLGRLVAPDVSQQLLALLAPVLSADQLAKLRNAIAEAERAVLSVAEARRLVVADIDRTLSYFAANGLRRAVVKAEIHKDPSLMNAYWDGSKVIFGMGMVNSDAFGPYEPGIVIHETTHAFFDILFEGESGSVAEHVCDVMAVVIRGGPWAIGLVRSKAPGAQQYLRSLSAPGTAYDSPILGKDPQVAHMRDISSSRSDNGAVHTNNGILNKAAYLISEGGEYSGLKLSAGIGRERLGKLYVRVIKGLSQKTGWKFSEFRNLVVQAASEESFDQRSVEHVRQSFAAVGL